MPRKCFAIIEPEGLAFDASVKTNRWPIVQETLHNRIGGSVIASVLFAIGETKDLRCFLPVFVGRMKDIAFGNTGVSDQVSKAVYRIFHVHGDLEYAEWLRGGLDQLCCFYANDLLPALLHVWNDFLQYLSGDKQAGTASVCAKKNAVPSSCNLRTKHRGLEPIWTSSVTCVRRGMLFRTH